MKIATIADIHFGYSINAEKLYNELQFFIDTVKKEKVDLIVILGDFFDKKLHLNSLASVYANKFINDLLALNSTVFFIHGTLSHDNNQIDIFSCYASEKFHIFKTMCEIRYKNCDILILPEEYVIDNSYYDGVKNKKYDYVFGHGMFKHNSFGTNNDGKPYYSSYIFDAKDFDNVKNYVVFGHVHTRSTYRKVVSNGSFSRMCFGEDEAKGFHIINDNKITFIENVDAPKYISIEDHTLSDDISILTKKLYGLLNMFDNVRIILTEDKEDKCDIIKSFAKNNYKNLDKNIVILDKRMINNVIQSIINKGMSDEDLQTIEKFEGKDFIQITLESYNSKNPDNILVWEDIEEILK